MNPPNNAKQKPKDRYRFPFEPYSIQVDFMNNLYSVLDNGGIGIFESPTGTVCLQPVLVD
jgi:chromosome transmission fidelity protein 1